MTAESVAVQILSITPRSQTSTPVASGSSSTFDTVWKVGELGVLVCVGGGFVFGLLVGLYILLRRWELA
jgi:hypothetical protein